MRETSDQFVQKSTQLRLQLQRKDPINKKTRVNKIHAWRRKISDMRKPDLLLQNKTHRQSVIKSIIKFHVDFPEYVDIFQQNGGCDQCQLASRPI